jgi:hypothetical protein
VENMERWVVPVGALGIWKTHGMDLFDSTRTRKPSYKKWPVIAGGAHQRQGGAWRATHFARQSAGESGGHGSAAERAASG